MCIRDRDYVSARADITEKFLSQIERGKAGLSVQTLIALCDILEITPNYVLLPDAARVLEEPIGPLLKGMSQRQLQDVEEMVRIFVRNCRHEEKGRPRGCLLYTSGVPVQQWRSVFRIYRGLGCPRRLFSEYRYLLPQPDGHEACFQHRKYFSDVYRKLSGRRQRHHKLACRSVGGFITDGEYQ